MPEPTPLQYPFQRKGSEWLSERRTGFLADGLGVGKAQPIWCNVLTPKGFKPIGSIKVGDKVIGRDGKPKKVLGVYPQGVKKYYQVEFTDGSKTHCCDDHLWFVRTSKAKFRNRPFVVKPLSQIRGCLTDKHGAKLHHIPITEPVSFNNKPRLPIDPYLLGVLLGHGSDTKFVPEMYLMASKKDRLSILQGLLDTDSYCGKRGVIQFSSNSIKLAENVKFLVLSLGGTVKCSQDISASGKDHYTVTVCLPRDVIPFRLERKLIRYPNRPKYIPSRLIKEVTYKGETECVCIGVEDSAYLTDDFIVTHNTIQAVGACDIVNATRILVICPGVARWNWVREFERFQTTPRLVMPIMTTKMMPNADVIVCSYSLIRRLPVLRFLLQQNFDVVVLDEAHNAKNPNATQTRALYGAKCDGRSGIVSRAKRVWILSGTPAPNNLGEIFSHCNALFKDVAPDCSTYNRWVDKYCIKKPMSDAIIGANKDTQPQLIASLRPYVLRRLSKDVLAELPSLRVNQISIRPDKLPPRSAEIAEIEMVLAAAIAKAEQDKSEDALQALKAVSETHLTTLRRWTGIALAPSVIQQIKDDIESGLSSFVVFAVHHAVIEMFLEQLPNTVGLYGKTKEGKAPGQRDYNIDAFQGRIPELKPQGIICAFDVASTAITLTEASRIYMPETPWVPSHIEQAIARVHRNGQKNPVIADIFSLEGSVHTQVIRTIMRKIKVLSVFNAGIQSV
jgi:hypothetical protein